jgi:hypothetical protein
MSTFLLWTILCAVLAVLSVPLSANAGGVSAVQACEADTNPPDDTARLTVLPNGEPRGSDTAAMIVKMARAKAKDGKDDEAIRWAALCDFSDSDAQAAIEQDRTAVLEYLKK